MSDPGGEREELERILRGFADHVEASWPAAMTAATAAPRPYHTEPRDWMNDWLQATWEQFVERMIPGEAVWLDPYGEGADYGRSSRVSDPHHRPTAGIRVIPRHGAAAHDYLLGKNYPFPEEGLLLDRFVQLTADWYLDEPPFDGVVVQPGTHEKAFRWDDVTFVVGAPYRDVGATDALVRDEAVPLPEEPDRSEVVRARLDQIAARCARATKGPWRSMVEDRDHFCGSDFIMTGPDHEDLPDIELTGATTADQDFIAGCRQDVPFLLALVRELMEARKGGLGPESE